MEMVTVEENVEVEMCTNIPAGPELCTENDSEHCEDQCRPIAVPQISQEEVETCMTMDNITCQHKPCQPIKELVPSNVTTCKNSPKECHSVPVEICEDVEFENCADKPPTVCKMVTETGM